jgi:hypothetical protein
MEKMWLGFLGKEQKEPTTLYETRLKQKEQVV